MGHFGVFVRAYMNAIVRLSKSSPLDSAFIGLLGWVGGGLGVGVVVWGWGGGGVVGGVDFVRSSCLSTSAFSFEDLGHL